MSLLFDLNKFREGIGLNQDLEGRKLVLEGVLIA